MSEWISVEDRFPDSKWVWVLACQSRNGIIKTARFTDGDWRTGPSEMDFIAEVTHWMPLPEPPK